MSDRSQPSAWLAACSFHTRTRAHTRAQTHRLTCTRSPSISLAPGGRVRGGGGTAGTGPWGCGGRVHRPPRKAPGRDESEAGGAAAAESSAGPPSIPGAAGGRGWSWDPGASGRGREKRVPAETRGGRTDRGWPPPAGLGAGVGGAGAREPTPPPCLAPGSTVLCAGFAQIPWRRKMEAGFCLTWSDSRFVG